MDAWIGVISQLVITGGAVAVAWLALRGKLAEISKTSSEAKTTTDKVHESLNNDPESITKRFAKMLKALQDIAATQDEHGRDIRGIREDVGILHGADRGLRKELSEHLEATAPMMPMLKDMHAQYSGKKGGTP